jgi:crotonobetainyl-CoA:carnitine CoA-transferase CaiB-like acyl-CoA transferase
MAAPAAPAAPRLSARPAVSLRASACSISRGSRLGRRHALRRGLGAECLKVEWKAADAARRDNPSVAGGPRDGTAPLKGETDPEMGGQFNNKNTGKRGLSLNVRDPRGLAIARELVKIYDVVAEGFSPGVLDRLGLGYAALTSIRPDIIYVQQSGMGSFGRYGRMRTVGPIAQAFSGASEMSGLPEPSMPAGWGYSYLDWMGAFAFAQAILGALYARDRTGKGQRIDASQCEVGLFSTARCSTGRRSRPWQPFAGTARHCSPAPPALDAPATIMDRHRVFHEANGHRSRGRGASGGADARFATLDARLSNQDALDALVTAWTSTQDAYACMHRLQAAGVPAGVCQTAGDRCDLDPQLAALEWLTEVHGTRIGTWPFAEFPVKLSATPAHIGGPINRAAPVYGEDNEYVLGGSGMSGPRSAARGGRVI